MQNSMKDASRISQERYFAPRSIIFASARTIGSMNSSVDIFLSNLESLITFNKWSNRVLAKKSGVSDRLIGMYRNREAVPSMDKAEKIANALGFELWQLQTPGLNPEFIKSGQLGKVLYAYIESDPEGKKVMEATAEYVVSHKKEPSNDKDKKNKGNAA